MFPRIRQFLAPPVFQDDKDKTRLAGLPLKIFLTTIVLPVMLGLFVLVIEPDPVLLLAFASIWLSLALGRLFMIYHITQHKQTEKALQESEERYRVVVEDQTEVISRFKADGIVLFVNDVYCCFFGKSSQELLGQKWQPVAVPEDIPGIEEKLKTLSPTNPVVINENRVYSGRGQVHWMQFINRGFFNQQGQLVEIQSVGRDITERKQIEEALRRAHDELEVRVAQRTAELQRTNQALEKEIIERQRAANQRQRLLEFSRTLLTTFSLDQRVELTQIALTDHVPHDTFAPYWLEEATGLLQPMETKGRHWFSTPEARRWPIPLGRGILGEVAQRRQAEYVNNAHLDPRSIYPPGQREQIAYEHLMALPLWGPEKMVGIVALSRVTLPPFTQEEFELVQLFMSQAALAWHNARLYEDLRNQMQALQAAQAQLVQSERMAALGRLIASIAHEINNPLQAIQGFCNLLTEEVSDRRRPEKIDYYLTIAGSEIERITGIIDRMRTFYRPASYIQPQSDSADDFFRLAQTESQAVDLHAVLESVLQLVNKKLQQENVKVERVWAKGLILLPANPDFLKQVFLNLTLNAIDAMAERGGTLRIETRLDQALFGHDRPHPAVRVEFSDTGVGMSPEVLSRLFEPLFSTKEQGSGFGLFTSYQIIQAHQGQITATSQPGEGTTFTILLPLK